MSAALAALAEAGPTEIAASALLLVGAAFSLVAAIGVVRLPDVLMRMHATSKAGTLGAGLIFVAAALVMPGLASAAKAIAAIAFVLLTAPVAAHVIGRAAYHSATPLSARTWIDERSRPGAMAGATAAAGNGADAAAGEGSNAMVSGPATPPDTTKRIAS